MIYPHDEHTASVLPNGKVSVAGGYHDTFLHSTKLYDPAISNWIPTGNIMHPRDGHTPSISPSGAILVTDGRGGTHVLSSTELYDPLTGKGTFADKMTSSHVYHTASVLLKRAVLVIGGCDQPNRPLLSSAELYYL